MTILADWGWKTSFHWKWVIFRVELFIYQRIYLEDHSIVQLISAILESVELGGDFIHFLGGKSDL